MRRTLLLTVAVAAAACTSHPKPEHPADVGGAARTAAESGGGGAFLVRLGNDTVAVEQYTRTGNGLEGQLIQRGQATVVQHYTVTLGPDGAPVSLELRTRDANGNEIPNRPRSMSLTFTGDTAVLSAVMRDSTITRRIAGRRVFPLLTSSFALYELPLSWMRRTGADSLDIQFLPVGGSRVTPYPARFVGTDSARVYYFGDPQRLRVDAQGRVLGVDATGTTTKVVVTRLAAPVDIAAIARQFASREGIVSGSPRDTVRATVGGAEFWVDYGRPSRRGRDLWANGVLGDTLWRTGANAATQIRFSRDLELGGRVIPAGTYTLFTLARGGEYQLIVNSQTGQWGTEYDRSRDVVRVPLTVGTGPETELFTIGVEPQGDGGRIVLRWGSRTLSAPFRVR